MSIESRLILTSYFAPGATPSSAQFANLIDSCLNLNDDGITVYTNPIGDKKVGIGSGEPDSRLGIKEDNGGWIDFFNADEPPVREWTFGSNDPANKGFSLIQPTAIGDISRLFVQGLTGFTGLGTVTPQRKLHIQDTAATDIVGWQTQNMSTGANNGWSAGHLSEVEERDGAFSIIEQTAVDPTERLVIRAGGNVGINELIPDVKLHVSRAIADPFAALDLLEGSGITVFGPMTDNLVFDYRGLQARHGEFIGDVLNITATTLNLQRLGGDILIHGDSTFEESIKGIITSEGWLGLGTITPNERVQIDGAIMIGTTDNTTDNDGTIRYNGTDFEGRKSGNWVSLTAGNGPWTIGSGNGIYYNAGTAPRVAIGSNTNVNTLDVTNKEAVTQGSIALEVINKSTTTSTGQDDDRVGLQISNNTLWGGDPMSKNIGLYVKEVVGQEDFQCNLAAVLNGNVVIGDLGVGTSVIGNNGQRVLAIQPGSSFPTTVPDEAAIQIYAGANAVGDSALNILTTDNILISLYRADGLSDPDMTAVGDAYTMDVANVINNLRTRLNELESRLKGQNLIA